MCNLNLFLVVVLIRKVKAMTRLEKYKQVWDKYKSFILNICNIVKKHKDAKFRNDWIFLSVVTFANNEDLDFSIFLSSEKIYLNIHYVRFKENGKIEHGTKMFGCNRFDKRNFQKLPRSTALGFIRKLEINNKWLKRFLLDIS